MKLAIIGGGISGLTLGVLASRAGAEVRIFERKDRVGKKLLATGNGRANVSNRDLAGFHWHSEGALPFDPGTYFSESARDDFFASLGMDLVEEDRGKLYPRTLKAQTVLNALRARFAASGGEEVCGAFITEIQPTDGGFILKSNESDYRADCVVVATGGRSMPKSGSDGKGYGLLEALGHRLTRTFPGITAIRLRSPYLAHLSGTKVQGAITLYRNGEPIDRRDGEILFAKDGVSGPPVLDLSRHISEKEGDYTVAVPMINHLDQGEGLREALEGGSYLPETVEGFLRGVVTKKWNHVLFKELDLKADEAMELLDYSVRMRLLDLLFSCSFAVSGVRGFDYAQVTCGGIALSEFKASLESKLVPGLYAIGEVLDVDGDCGGYNIHWAMAGAHRVYDDLFKK